VCTSSAIGNQTRCFRDIAFIFVLIVDAIGNSKEDTLLNRSLNERVAKQSPSNLKECT